MKLLKRNGFREASAHIGSIKNISTIKECFSAVESDAPPAGT